MAENRFDICGGPSKYDLMVSLFERGFSRTVTFRVGLAKLEMEVVITGIDMKDASGEVWDFRGRVQNGFPNGNARTIEGYYSSLYRHGSFTITTTI